MSDSLRFSSFFFASLFKLLCSLRFSSFLRFAFQAFQASSLFLPFLSSICFPRTSFPLLPKDKLLKFPLLPFDSRCFLNSRVLLKPFTVASQSSASSTMHQLLLYDHPPFALAQARFGPLRIFDISDFNELHQLFGNCEKRCMYLCFGNCEKR